jgi:urease gamma subunit
MATIGDVTIRIGATTRQLESDLKRAERALAATGKKFSDLGAKMSLNLSLPIAAIGAASFKMASDVEESLNKVRVAFGSSSTEVEAFADTTLESFGIARGSALDMAALFGDMATSMGITQSESAKLSTSLVGLAGDLASFKNIALSEVQTALSGIFTGETESLKRLGVVMLETNLEAFALEKGITKKYKAMTQAEKVALRYEFVLNATKNAQGDFARTSDGAANQMRIFQESLKEVGAQFGSVLLPILTPVIKAFNTLLKGLSSLTETQKNFIVGLLAVTATLGPLISLVGSLYSTYAEAATAIIRLGVVTTATGTAAEVTAFSFRKLVASLGPIALGIAAVSAAIALVTYSLGDVEKKQSEINTAQKEAATIVAREGVEVKRLVNQINAETTSKEDKRKALVKLQQIHPEYFKGISDERDMIAKVNTQYGLYVSALQKKAAAQVAETRLQKNAEERLNTQEELAKVNKEIFDLERKGRPKASETLLPREGGADVLGAIQNYDLALKKAVTRSIELNDQLKKITANDEQLANFVNEYDKLLTVTETGGGGDGKESPLTQTLKGLNEELVILERRFKAGIIDSLELSDGKVEILRKRFLALIDAGTNPLNKSVLDVKNSIASLQQVSAAPFVAILSSLEGVTVKSDETKENIKDLADKMGKSFVDISNRARTDFVNRIVEGLQTGMEVIKSFAATMEGTLVSAFTLVGETIGQAFTGDSDIDSFFNSILQLVANFAKDFGKQLIAIGVAKLALEELFAAGPVGAAAAIIAGTALVAASAALSSSLQKKLPSLAIGTDRVKSDGMAYLHKGEAVVPASVVEGGFTGGANGTQVYGRLSGIDLLLSNRYAGGYYNRLR